MSAGKDPAVDQLAWRSALTDATADRIAYRGYDLADLIRHGSFAAVVYLLFVGELPEPSAARLLDAVLIACADHGPQAPSVLAARTVASTGAEMSAAGAAGLLALSRFHGAAIADSMALIARVADAPEPATEALRLAAELRQAGRRAAGFGHRWHKARDPRRDALFGLAETLGYRGRYVEAALALERALEEVVGRPLPINIDGIAAALCLEIGLPRERANALFLIARLAGILAHVFEEQTHERPMRKIHPVAVTYDGPAPRDLPPAWLQGDDAGRRVDSG